MNRKQDNQFYRLNRRSFLQQSAIAAVLSTMAGAKLLTGKTFAQGTVTDLDILNYALTLEHLESRAYQDVNNIGLLSGSARDYFLDFGDQEAAHVVALTGTIIKLGGTPMRAQDKYNFPQFKSGQEVLDYFQILEELGAAAYLGAAPLIQDKDLLTAAVGIHNVEGQHAAILGELVGQSPEMVFGEAKTMEQILAVVAPLLSAAPAAMPSTGRGGYVTPAFGSRFFSE